MTHFKAKMHQIRFLVSVRLPVRVLYGVLHFVYVVFDFFAGPALSSLPPPTVGYMHVLCVQ